jgi:putative transposase
MKYKLHKAAHRVYAIHLHPDNNISQLVKSLKSETSKMIQTEFESEFNAVYYKTALWGRQKFIVSCGGAPLKIVQEYIKNQTSPQH